MHPYASFFKVVRSYIPICNKKKSKLYFYLKNIDFLKKNIYIYKYNININNKINNNMR